ncbi:hypothetical protein D3C85_676890 [compost metagenome]
MGLEAPYHVEPDPPLEAVGDGQRYDAGRHHLQQIPVLQVLGHRLYVDGGQPQLAEQPVELVQALVITGAGPYPDPPTGELGDAVEARQLPLAHHPLLDGRDERLGEGDLLAPGRRHRQVGRHQIPPPLGEIVQQLVLTHRDVDDLELELLPGEIGLVQPALEALQLIDQDAVLGTLVEEEEAPFINHQGPEFLLLQYVFEIPGLGQEFGFDVRGARRGITRRGTGIRRQQRERTEDQQGPNPSHHEVATFCWSTRALRFSAGQGPTRGTHDGVPSWHLPAAERLVPD